MKRNLVIISIILINVAAIVLLLINYRTTEFPEKVFEIEKSDFNSRMTEFVGTASKNVNTIVSGFSNAGINDSAMIDYFVEFMDKNALINSTLILKNDFKFIIRRSKDSYEAGYNNEKNMELVKWKRIRDGKMISEWDEIFELSGREKDWFKKLIHKPDTLLWFFDTGKHKNKEKEDLFYCGYFHNENGDSSFILFKFSRLALLKDFSAFNHYENINLMVEINDGTLYNLSTGMNEFFRATPEDSVKQKIHKHLAKFAGKQEGMFTIRHNNEVIWTFFHRFNPALGLHFYLITIPESELLMNITNHNLKMIIAYAALLTTSFLIVYLIYRKRKKEKTYGNQMSLKEILKEDESRYLEFKSSLRWDYRQQKVNPALEEVVVKTVAAFGNSDGGTLLIGVDDDKNILGLENDYNTLKKQGPDYFEIHLRNLLHKVMGVKYVTENIRMTFLKHGKKEVCKVEVFRAAEPVFIEIKDKNGNKKEKFYVRSGNSSHELDSLRDINEYINKRF